MVLGMGVRRWEVISLSGRVKLGYSERGRDEIMINVFFECFGEMDFGYGGDGREYREWMGWDGIRMVFFAKKQQGNGVFIPSHLASK